MSRAGLERLADLVNADASLVRRGRYLSTRFLVETGAVAGLITVHEGRGTALERGPFLLREWTFAVGASEDAWRRFWDPVPAAGYHDLSALTKVGHAGVEGALPPLMPNPRYRRDWMP